MTGEISSQDAMITCALDAVITLALSICNEFDLVNRRGRYDNQLCQCGHNVGTIPFATTSYYSLDGEHPKLEKNGISFCHVLFAESN